MSDRVAGLKFKAKQTIDGKSLTFTVTRLTKNYHEYGEQFVFLEKWICNSWSQRRPEILTTLKTKTSRDSRALSAECRVDRKRLPLELQQVEDKAT